MKRSKKVLLSTVAVIGLSVASVSLVSAFGGPGGHGGHGGPGGFGGCDRSGYGPSPQWQQGRMMHRPGFDGGFGFGMEDMMQNRLDRMKYELRITKEQEPAWKEFTESASKKMTTMRDRMQQRGMQGTVAERVKLMRDGATNMTEMADAIEKLHKTLTPEQQKITDQISPRMMRGF